MNDARPHCRKLKKPARCGTPRRKKRGQFGRNGHGLVATDAIHRRAMLRPRSRDAIGQGRRDHLDRNDRRRQCGRLALVYRHPERLLRRRRHYARRHLCADRVRPGAAAVRGLARHRRRRRCGRADPRRRKRRAGRPPAHRRPGVGLRDDGQADHRHGEGSQRQDHLHRRPGRHQPRLSRAHHAGQRTERRRLRHHRGRQYRRPFRGAEIRRRRCHPAGAAGQLLRRGLQASTASA